MLGCVPASVAFETRSNNKKKGDKRGDLRGKENYPPRRCNCKIRDSRSELVGAVKID